MGEYVSIEEEARKEGRYNDLLRPPHRSFTHKEGVQGDDRIDANILV